MGIIVTWSRVGRGITPGYPPLLLGLLPEPHILKEEVI